ncbi:acyl-CoA thioesterase [Rhodotorula paludigena]|uniref:acyl-CoA thioesterase n=1 Tax=Rhodotorula paludigena TaxID=86838 RepID=UPI003175E07E
MELPPGPPLGNAQHHDIYLSGREAALQYAADNGFDVDCCVELPVQWGDMDSMRHVNNARYLRFLETGRMVHMRACTADIRNDEVKKALNGGTEGVGFIFGEVKYRYLRPVVYPDNILVMHKTVSLSRRKMIIQGVIYSYAQQAAAGVCDGIMVAYDYDAQRSAEWPSELVEAMKARGATFDESAGKETAKL